MPVPPMPISGRAEGYLKESFWIVLQASGRIEEPLEFLIRKDPRKGTLRLPIERTGPKTAKVLYTPFHDAMPGEDFFTYAAQSVDSPVSVSARIDIDLRLQPAVLEYPQILDFGEVRIGDSVTLDVRLSNSGGRSAALQILANPPWRLAEPPPNGITGGGQAVLSLIFEPASSGDFRERLLLTSEGHDFIVLRGSSQAAFSWPTPGLAIPTEARNRSDHAIPFTNLTANARVLEFDWPSGVEAPARLEIPAHSTVPVSVALENASPSFFFSGPVAFRSGNFSASFPLLVGPAPANLVFDPPDQMDLGEAPMNGNLTGKLLVTNSGGLPAGLKMERPQELTLRPDPSGILVGPGDTVEFEISAKTSKPGNFSLALPIGPAEGPWRSLKVDYAIRSPQPVEKLLQFPVETPKLQELAPLLAQIPAVTECLLVESGPHDAVIKWKHASPEAVGYILDRREIDIHQPGKIRWVRWETPVVEISGDWAVARFRKLPANSFWYFRIIGLDSKKIAGPPSPAFRLQTLPLEPFLPWWIWVILLVTGVAGAWKILKTHVKIRFGPLDKASRI